MSSEPPIGGFHAKSLGLESLEIMMAATQRRYDATRSRVERRYDTTHSRVERCKASIAAAGASFHKYVALLPPAQTPSRWGSPLAHSSTFPLK